MRRVNTYLTFDGNCREAMRLHQKCLSTEIRMTPVMDAQGTPSNEAGARIMHSQLLRNGQPILLASDDQPGSSPRPGDNFNVSVERDWTDLFI